MPLQTILKVKTLVHNLLLTRTLFHMMRHLADWVEHPPPSYLKLFHTSSPPAYGHNISLLSFMMQQSMGCCIMKYNKLVYFFATQEFLPYMIVSRSKSLEEALRIP